MKKIVFAAVVLFLTSLAVSAGEPWQPTDLDRARWTMSDMVSWRTALAAYRQDHASYPAARTLEEARAAVEGRYIAHVPMVDAWGNPYRYEALPDGYRLTSGGADGRFDAGEASVPGRLSSFDDDAVATHEGRWLFRFWSLE